MLGHSFSFSSWHAISRLADRPSLGFLLLGSLLLSQGLHRQSIDRREHLPNLIDPRLTLLVLDGYTKLQPARLCSTSTLMRFADGVLVMKMRLLFALSTSRTRMN